MGELNVFDGKNLDLVDAKYLAVQIFYRGFNARQIEAVRSSWSNSESITMANPIGGIRKGPTEIFEGYAKIFSSPHEVYVELHDFEFFVSDSIFVINGQERGHVTSMGKTVKLKIRTTRVFRLEGIVWKQFCHHGSIDDPALLKNYQEIILRR